MIKEWKRNKQKGEKILYFTDPKMTLIVEYA